MSNMKCVCLAIGGAVSASNGMARLEHRRAPWTAGPHSSHSRSGLRSSHVKEASACVVQGPARGAGKAWREQQQWGLEDEKVAGVHWSYEETKTFLAILRESRFYETLQACPRNSQVYGAVAEWLRECGFLRTPEQCRTKFKSLQKSYRKARSGHVLEPCAFYREMDALINARAPGPTLGDAPCPSGQEREGMGMEPQDAAGWEPEPPSPAATAGDSGSERLSGEEAVPEPERQGPAGGKGARGRGLGSR